ncbi:DNA topoisomerase [Pterulicium gracile]|uniref:DNA topoisomerase 2 n=1 Tax=Pterulicium gracile TaxID=1884261 RepID=A0A5C3QW15_9AGAR|nr:DNA topoisomerase [Pterula gracilis]
MSSDEGEPFDLDNLSGSDEDDFQPVKKKAPAKPKAAKPSAKTKAKAPPKKAAKKVLEDIDDNVDEDAMDIDEQDFDDMAKEGATTTTKKKKTASETYTKLSQLEHILKRPDSYIGSVESITQQMWTWDVDEGRLAYRNVTFVPGFFKIVDEILVNAADNKINDASMDTIKVTIDTEKGTISVHNNGRGIPIEMHSKENMYIPELIFGHLLSSSNYDDDEKKLTGGRNGYGAKLANIYSTEFTVETADKNSSQIYRQTWSNNMSKVGKAKITKNTKGEEWTRVTFTPDLPRFGMTSIDPDTTSLLMRRVYDMCGTVSGIKVLLNNERLKVKNFKQYVEMYLESVQKDNAATSGGAAQAKPIVLYERINPRWEIGFALSSEGVFQQVSFANSISTSKGGTHVNYIADQLAKHLLAAIQKKNKGATVKAPQIKNHMWIFVNALIENPTFDSQTKETMTLSSTKFGSRPQLSEEFIKKVMKSEIVERILDWAKFKADQQIKKTDGSKRSRLTGMPKLSDANNAGTRTGSKCTLILTEGDSAKGLAIAGMGVVGRDNFGVFPLRGKLLNVREAKHDQIMKNEEIQNMKRALGLQHNKEYTDTTSLRYGRIMIMTDQDHDGSHIKGLIINFLDHFYPSLLKLPEFLVEFVTPIVRAKKGKQVKDFFTIPEYEKWLEETPNVHTWESKYYKGLGTSTDDDARDYFGNMAKHMIPFAPTQDGEKELIDLAFSKKKADERKTWLRALKPDTYLDHNTDQITIEEFINKELILFSMADNIRSIPSVADGLKPGQRKVIWSCFKRNLKKEIKVAQLSGYVSEHGQYHHGEQSLHTTIVNLAQDFLGSNNINLLMPNGQYGSRELGGKDAASARYIYTQLSPLTRLLFNAADDSLLKQQKEDNRPIEPETYLTIIPLVLVNGAEGIGTGWSTNIPPFNPVDIISNLRRLMNNEDMLPMIPWFRDFKGYVRTTAKQKFDTVGVARKVDDTTIEITELPINKWNQAFKAELEALIEEKGEPLIKDYKEYHDKVNVHYVVMMTPKGMEKAEAQGFEEFFRLVTKVSTTNMMCFGFDGTIKKYESPEEILEEFYPIRLAFYQKRKDALAKALQDGFEKLSNQARFIQMIVDKQLVISNRKKADIVGDLKKHEFRPYPKGPKAVTTETSPEQDEDDDEGETVMSTTTDFDYLLSMGIWNLTKEKIEKLKKQAGEKEAELLELLAKSPKDLWNTDLDELLEANEKYNTDRKERQEMDAQGKKVKKKQAVLETRKSVGGSKKRSARDDDDDFMPTKPAPKKRAPASEVKQTEAAKGKAKAKPDSVAKAPVKKATAKSAAAKSAAADSDVELVAPEAGPSKKPAAKATKRKSTDFADESDDDFTVKPPTKKKALQSQVTDFFGDEGKPTKAAKPPAPKKAAPRANSPEPPKSKKPTKVVESSDEEVEISDDEFDSIPRPPARNAAPRAARTARAKTKAYVEISSEGEEAASMYDEGDDGDDD